MRFGVPPVGPDLGSWADQLRRWLALTWDSLTFKQSGASANQDGILLWDTAGYPVVSKDGEFRQIVLADGYLAAAVTQDVTAALANTAYAITWDTSSGDGVTVAGDTLTFEEAGQYLIAFTAQIASSSASTVNFWFWPEVNGVDVTGSTMKASLHNNGATIVVSRATIFQFAAGDDLRAMWATDSTSGFLSEEAATAFAPETPSVTIAVTRVRQ